MAPKANWQKSRSGTRQGGILPRSPQTTQRDARSMKNFLLLPPRRRRRKAIIRGVAAPRQCVALPLRRANTVSSYGWDSLAEPASAAPSSLRHRACRSLPRLADQTANGLARLRAFAHPIFGPRQIEMGIIRHLLRVVVADDLDEFAIARAALSRRRRLGNRGGCWCLRGGDGCRLPYALSALSGAGVETVGG